MGNEAARRRQSGIAHERCQHTEIHASARINRRLALTESNLAANVQRGALPGPVPCVHAEHAVARHDACRHRLRHREIGHAKIESIEAKLSGHIRKLVFELKTFLA